MQELVTFYIGLPMDASTLGAFLLILTFGKALKYDAPKTQLPNFLHEASGNITGRPVEVIEHGRRVLPRVTLGHWREKKGERSPSTLPLEEEGKEI